MKLRAVNVWLELLFNLTAGVWVALQLAGVKLPNWADALILTIVVASFGCWSLSRYNDRQTRKKTATAGTLLAFEVKDSVEG